ncbi:MAG TPA: 50S ribosomal protein L21 [Firmicutes bacterium]|nr:50S ribosomal protein L21 [Bacillota bacterium]
MYAIVETGGKQYKVSAGERILVEKLDAENGAEIVLDKVLLLSGADGIKVGQPYVPDAKVLAKVEDQILGPKIRGFKYKAKKNMRRRYGHRQPYTTLLITGVGVGDKIETIAVAPAEPRKEEEPAAAPTEA